MTRTSARGLAASAKVPVQSWGLPRRSLRLSLPAVLSGSVRKRVAVGRDVRVVAESQGEYKGLHLPGHVTVRHSWHPRLDVVLLEDELRIAGNGVLATFPLSEMVLASYCVNPRGALRVDLLADDHVTVRLCDQGQLMERLRHQIWEYEKSLMGDTSETDWALDVSPALLAEAEAAMDAADARLRDSGRSLQQDRVAQELVTRSVDLRREARVDAIRRRRTRMLNRTDA